MTEDTSPSGELRRIRGDLEHISVGIDEFARRLGQPRPIDRIRAAMILSLTIDACRSILQGEPVLAKNLDGVVLNHALRGKPLPDPSTYILVTDRMLNSIVEAAP